MANELLSDGTVSWVGGMDTSRHPSNISEIQYSKACNIIIPNSLGGVRSRFGIHCAHLEFENNTTKNIYRKGVVQAECWFKKNNIIFLAALVDGYVLLFRRQTKTLFTVTNLTKRRRNIKTHGQAWGIPIPGGCIFNNSFDLPIFVNESRAKRLHESKGELGIGRMGVYLQHRLFYVDQSGTQIRASDYMHPTKFTREGTNIIGFMCPDAGESITAIGKQKSIIGTVEGGNLIWSSDRDIYSADVRGTRSDWANQGSSVGKTTETVPGFSACSSYSFESFNTNVYLRSSQFGMVDIRQAEYQFANYDTLSNQSVEASYYFDNDTDWMLDRCYTRACNQRLFTTVAPELHENGGVYWNGMLSMFPASVQVNQGSIPRRFESVFTGVRPWCMTVVKSSASIDELFIHSHDKDGINRLYLMDESTDYDTDHSGKLREIEGFVETRAFTFSNALTLKQTEKRFYSLGQMPRTVKIKLFSRPDGQGEWFSQWTADHLICRNKIENHVFTPKSSKPQARPLVSFSSEKFERCYPSTTKFLSIQYRVEFTGPIQLDSIALVASAQSMDTTTTSRETECKIMTYNFKPDYSYSILPTLPQ